MDLHYILLRSQWQAQRLRRYRRVVEQANTLESGVTGLSEEAIRQRIGELHDKAQGRKRLDSLLPDALALGREISRRTLGMRHFDVQLIGALALFDGLIAEMNTGEGKTLMAPLAAWLHHLGHYDKCCHIVTANEYLAERDARWMGPYLKGLGLSTGVIIPGQSSADRARAYQHDVVYATSREIVFDSLREPVRKKRTHSADAILRPQLDLELNPSYNFVIVDEVDSVLIDQARSPLSLGANSGASPQIELYRHADTVAGQLVRGQHYRLMHDDRSVELKDDGKAEARRRAGNALRLLPVGHKWERYVTCALAARYIYKVDHHYVVRNGRVVLIDDSTGRLLPGRQLPDGIHQAIEVRNGLAPSIEVRGAYQTTFQTFFRKYDKIAGMTGTASMAALEFLTVYGLKIMPIPPNKPMRRNYLGDLVYRNPENKHNALMEKIAEIHATGRPILIGAGSVNESELIGRMLEELGLTCDILNAKNHAREAEIIAQAGHRDRITIITNMAGRGVDIKLGPGVADLGGLFLLSTDRLPFRRLDWQLIGRIGRQGDPGDCLYFLSLKDELLRNANRKTITRLRNRSRQNRHAPVESPKAVQLFDKIQRHFEKVTTRQRKRMYQYEKHREKMKDQGLWEDWMDIR